VTERQLRDASKQAAKAGGAKDKVLPAGGSFQNPADADNLKARLAMIGVEASVEPADLAEKGVWYRVRLGPFTQVEEINRLRQQLAQNGVDRLARQDQGPSQTHSQEFKENNHATSPDEHSCRTGLACATNAQAAPTEGIDYLEVKPPQATDTAEKSRSFEFFWYRCPHCYALEPELEAWVNDLSAARLAKRSERVKDPRVDRPIVVQELQGAA